ncbi:peptide MFS transporter [Actinotignum timonense]|uniref:peptide MFS transporter n=1 Tax=Actinotignum timonense TaxID=1870995 RepID=UPI002A820DA8|nr:peptide MFS transporter [Actinotignum timonense]MDY5158112.1 peptide MFS transporter [Actinotignum timonense]
MTDLPHEGNQTDTTTADLPTHAQIAAQVPDNVENPKKYIKEHKEALRRDRRARATRSFMGQPTGLYSLFGLELWERFSYLGFQAILVLYFTDAIASGGLGYAEDVGSSIVAAYGALVYLLSIAGAWIADRISGTYRTVLWGGIVIAAGHIAMGIPTEFFTWVGLGLIVVGTGLLKPNVSTMVGELYAPGDSRRDAGFSIYYAGINIGAFLGPLVAGFLGQRVHWHAGFASAAVGMILGLIAYVATGKNLSGRAKAHRIRASFVADRSFWMLVGLVGGVVAVATLFATFSSATLSDVVNGISVITWIVPVFFFLWMYRSPKVTPVERRNLIPYALLLIALILYNLLYFQTGNTLNLVALNATDNTIGSLSYPSSYYISLTAIVEIIMGPVLAWIWLKMGKRQPHVAAKVGLGAVLGGIAFVIVALAGILTPRGALLMPLWLVGCYIFLGLGDLVLQTSGMSATTKLAPRAFASQTMALWFTAMACAQGIQAQVVKFFDYENMAASIPAYFGVQGAVVIGYGVLLMALTPWMRSRMKVVA